MCGVVATITILLITVVYTGIGALSLITVTLISTTVTWQPIRSEKSPAAAERTGEAGEKLREELHHCHRELRKASLIGALPV